jgi:hypothetical protein
MPSKLAVLFSLPVSLSAIFACGHDERRFESTCQIVHREVVETDGDGTTAIIDLELEWDPCPGDQFQMVRGGRQFAECMQRYPDGILLPVLVKQWRDNRGFYTWDIYRVGDCVRPIEAGAEGSYEKSQECSNRVMHGQVVGFSCLRRPQKHLIASCPWMARD